MRYTRLLIPTLALTFSSLSWAAGNAHFNMATDAPRSLRESIAVAIKYNSKTVSTDDFLESLRLSTLAMKARMYPNGSLYCNKSVTTSHFTYTGTPYDSRANSTDCGVSASMTLYDGGSALNSYRGAKASYEATKAAYNTTDSLIPNTRGGLANSVMEYYVEMTRLISTHQTNDVLLKFLNEFKKVDDTDNLETKITSIKQSNQEIVDGLSLLRDSFNHLVTRQPSDNLDTLDQTIASLIIPTRAEDAIKIALLSGPEVTRRNLNVQMAEYNLKSVKASLGPQVSVYASLDRLNSVDNLNPTSSYNGTSRTIGIQVSIPIGLSGIYSVDSAAKDLESKEAEKRAAIDDAKFEIYKTYKSLENNKRYYLTAANQLNTQLGKVDEVIQKINAGQTNVINVSDLLVMINNLQDQFTSLRGVQVNIISQLYSIQQVTGILFTEMEIVH